MSRPCGRIHQMRLREHPSAMKRLALASFVLLGLLAVSGALFFVDSDVSTEPIAVPRPDFATAPHSETDGDGALAVAADLVDDTPERTTVERDVTAVKTVDQIAKEAPATTLEIRVEDPDAKDVRGAEVALYVDRFGRDSADMAFFKKYEQKATTSGSGRVTFAIPPLGMFRVVVEKKGFARAELGSLLPNDSAVVKLKLGARLEVLVLDDVTGHPVADASALLDARGKRYLARSDADGKVAFSDITEDVYQLEVVAQGLDRARIDGIQAEVSERPPVPIEVRLAAGLPIRGIVREAKTERPIAGARIVLESKRTVNGDEIELLGVDATTDAAGEYRIDGAPRDGARLVVAAPTCSTERADVRDPGEGEEIRIDFSLKTAVKTSGRVRDSRGNPIADARIAARYGAAEEFTATSSDDGSFELVDLRADQPFDVLVKPPAPDLAPGILRGVVAMQSGETSVPLEIILDPSAGLLGKVLLQDGSPAPHALVVLSSLPDSVWRTLGSAPIAFTDETGFYRFSGLPAQVAQVRAELNGMRSALTEIALPAEGEASCDLILDKSAVMRGIVVDVAGEPVVGARVTVSAQESRFNIEFDDGSQAPKDPKNPQPKPSVKVGNRRFEVSEWRERGDDLRGMLIGRATGGRDRAIYNARGAATTDDNGSFEIHGLDVGEKLLLSVRHDEHEPYLELGAIADGALRRIELMPFIQLRGCVVDGRSYQPVEDFSVVARPIDEPPPVLRSVADVLKLRRPRQNSFDSPDGTFALRGLSPGRWEIVVRAPGYKEARGQRLDLVRGQKPNLLIEMVPASRIRGRVIARDGTPLRSVPIFLRDAPPPDQDPKKVKVGRNGAKTRQTDGKGNFSFGDLEPRAYLIGIGQANRPIGDFVRIELKEGDLVEHVFNVGDTGSIEVQVDGQGGFSLGRARVQIVGAKTRVRQSARTDSSGRIRFGPLLPDDYRVQVDAAGHESKTETIKVGGGDSKEKNIHLSAR